ncbi:TPA: glycosyltransferase family 2 protein [Yersinia enterocolitica]|nr:glycosyltransferase family 2 protein [Yersinia enterocolitica]
MSSDPIISVIMSVYNGQEYLKEAIDSILEQTEPRFEFIIINDSSTDNSLEIIKDYKILDDRIIIINNEVNLKLPASLNKGIKIARGKYIARMDADDIALPERFELQLAAMERNPSLDFIGGLVECFYDKNNDGDAYADTKYMEDVHFNFISETGDLEKTSELIKLSTYKTTRICHSTLFGKTVVFKELRYTEDIFAEDWDLYNRAINRGFKISKIPNVILKYRIVNSGMCGSFNEQSPKDARRKIDKLNDGILKDCIKTRSIRNALKFYWYHYLRYNLATMRITIKHKVRHIVLTCMSKIYKSLSLAQLKTLKRTLEYVNRGPIIRKIPIINKLVSISLHVLNQNKDVSCEPLDTSEPRFNIGVWTIEKKWAMGGLNTIFKLLPTLLNNNIKVRVINYGLHSDLLKENFFNYITELVDVEPSLLKNIEIISANTYRNNIDTFNKDDKFIAGFWESAEDFIKNRSLNHFSTEKFVYIIQDYEPSMLYRWGSEYIRSKETLCDNNYYPIFNNSVFVCGYMKKLGIIDSWQDVQMLKGEPCETLPPNIEDMKKASNNINIVFYSRPTVDKNIYEIKISALKKFIDHMKNNHPDIYKSMTITGIGENAKDVEYNGFTIRNMGKVSYKEYPELLKSYNVGLSCIVSPAFAYPCIEFPRAGIVTVVNRFENRDLEIYSQNIVSCDSTDESIFKALLTAVSRVNDVEVRYSSSSFQLPGVSIEVAANAMLNSLNNA